MGLNTKKLFSGGTKNTPTRLVICYIKNNYIEDNYVIYIQTLKINVIRDKDNYINFIRVYK